MGQITLQIPQAGQPNSTEDPKVASDLTTIQTLVNGNLDTNNLAANAGILKSQLASGAGSLVMYDNVASSYTATDGQMVNCSTADQTITLPVATQTSMVGVRASNTQPITAATANTVQTQGGAQIFSPGMTSGATSVNLGAPGAFMVLLGTAGGDWRVIAGAADSGWALLTISPGLSAVTGTFTPAVRVIAGMAQLCGAIQSGTAQSAGTIVATIPAGYRPSKTLYVPGAALEGTGFSSLLTIDTSGNITQPNPVASGTNIYAALDSITYRLS